MLVDSYGLCYSRNESQTCTTGGQRKLGRLFVYMHGLIEKLLHKRGIRTPDQLDQEEKQTFENWQLVLNKDELTTSDITAFCRSQISVIENKWKDFDTTNEKKAELIPYHVVYKTLLAAIESPKSAKGALEIHLNQLLNQ